MPKKLGEALKSVVGEGFGEGEERKGKKESVLMNTNRQLIYQFLILHPCCNVRKVAGELKMSPPTIKWHLDKLEAGGYVSSSIVKNKKVFYPTMMIPEGDMVAIMEAIQRDKVGMTFLSIVENQGSTQREIAEVMQVSSQSVRGYISLLERLGLIVTIIDGRHKRYFPSEKLKMMERTMRKRIRNFRRFLLKKLNEDRLNPSVDLSRRREAEITIRVSRKKGTFKIPEEPFSSSVISLLGGE